MEFTIRLLFNKSADAIPIMRSVLVPSGEKYSKAKGKKD